MRKYVTEFVGTFFLVLTVTCAVLSGSALAPLGIGVVLAAMVFAGGHISGAHYNPAVTIAVWVRGRIGTDDLIGYFAAQFVAGALAALLGRWLVGWPKVDAIDPTGRHLVAALIVELLFTFGLAYVVLNVATSKDHPNNSFYGLAIGFTVLAGAVAVGGISGGVFNPAVGLGLASNGMLSWVAFLLYLIVLAIGGAGAGYAYRYLNPDDLRAPVAPAGVVAPETPKQRNKR